MAVKQQQQKKKMIIRHAASTKIIGAAKAAPAAPLSTPLQPQPTWAKVTT